MGLTYGRELEAISMVVHDRLGGRADRSIIAAVSRGYFNDVTEATDWYYSGRIQLHVKRAITLVNNRILDVVREVVEHDR
jgi:hypothetical protein